MNDQEFSELVKKSKSRREILKALGEPENGSTYTKLSVRIKNLALDTSHFLPNGPRPPKKDFCCPVCSKKMKLSMTDKRQTCSKSCSNLYRPRGNATKLKNYRTICFAAHTKECVVCGEYKAVEVHHYDENHKNNTIDNLVPICPNHHDYLHNPKYRHEVIGRVDDYVDNFKKTFTK